MGAEDSAKKVTVGLKLQSDRLVAETGPATVFIIPATEIVMDPNRDYSLLRGENSPHIIGAVPLNFHMEAPLTIYGYPDKGGVGELLAMAIANGVKAQKGATTAYDHVFNPDWMPPVATMWRDSRGGCIKTSTVAVNKLTIKIPENKEMQITADLLGCFAEILDDIGTPTCANYPEPGDGGKVFRSGILTLTYGAAGAAIRTAVTDVEIAIDRGVVWDEGQTQDVDFPHTMVANKNELTATIEFLMSDLVELQRVWEGTDGVPSVTTPQSYVGLMSANLKYTNLSIAKDVGAHAFVGAGLNDCTSGGAYTGAADAVFTVQIDAELATDTFKWKKDAEVWTEDVAITGAAQTLEEGVTVTFGATTGHSINSTWLISCTAVDNGVGTATFTAGGLDDFASGGTFTGTADTLYEVELDHEATPDTFKWRKTVGGVAGSYTEDVAITGAAQVLDAGVTITFTATTGHFLGSKWSFTAHNYAYKFELNMPSVSANLKQISKGGREAGRLILTPIACPVGTPYTITLTNTTPTDYAPA